MDKDDLIEALQLKLEREVKARQTAERIIEEKSRDLYELNCSLEKRVSEGIEEKQQFAFALSHCENGIAIVARDLRLLWNNESFRKVFELEPHSTSDLNQLDKRFESTLAQALKLARTQRGPHSIEIPIRRSEEPEFYVATVTPVQSDMSQDQKFVIVISDTTSLRRTETELANRDRHYRGIFDRTGLGLVKVKGDCGTILDVNEGMTRELELELRGKKFWDYFSRGNQQLNTEFFRKSAGNVELEFCLGTAESDEKKWYLATCVPFSSSIQDDELAVTLVDITDQKNFELALQDARAKAEESNQAKRRFVANVSHEIKTPVNSLAGLIDLINPEHFTESEKHFFTAIRSSAKVLNHLTSDILDIYRIEENKLDLRYEPFVVRVEISHQVEYFRTQLDRRKVKLHFSISENTPLSLTGDPGRYCQILANIVGNAIKFTEAGFVRIDINSRFLSPQKILLTTRVSDSGIGVNSEMLDRVFEEFERCSVDSNRYRGTGLGLSIAKKLVEALGGKIQIESQVTQGTLVTFEIPFDVDDSQHNEPIDGAKVENLLEGIQILITEDDPFNQLFFRSTLERAKAITVIAENGRKALQLASEKEFDLIFMDVRMPELDGIKTTQILRTQNGSQTPIIGLSANTTEEDRTECLEAGMNDFLPKPCSPEQILQAAAKIISQKSPDQTIN